MTGEGKSSCNRPIPLTVWEERRIVDLLRAKFPHMCFCIAAVDNRVAHATAEQITALLRQAGWTIFESRMPDPFPDGICIDYGDDATHAGRFFSNARQAATTLVQELGRIHVNVRTGLGNGELGQYDLHIVIGRNDRGA